MLVMAALLYGILSLPEISNDFLQRVLYRAYKLLADTFSSPVKTNITYIVADFVAARCATF